MSKFEREPLKGSGIFFDSADLELLKIWLSTGILGGITTNPVVLNKSNVLNVPEHIQKMVEIAGPGFPISIEIPDSSWDKEKMIKMALWYRDKFTDNAVIKIPMDPREPTKAYEVMNKLAEEGVRLNATLGLSSGQLVFASEAMRNSKADGDNYISLFWARREEAKRQEEEEDPNVEAADAATTLKVTLAYLENHSLQTKIIVGSIRNINQIEQAFLYGADIVTMSPELMQKWITTERGKQTAIEFNEAFNTVASEMILGL